MSKSLLRHAVAPTIAGVLLLSTACTSSEPEELTGPKDHAKVTDAGGFKPDNKVFDESSDDEERPGLLMGPHFSLGIAGYSVTKKASEKQAKAYGFDEGPVTAEKGTELFVAVMTEESSAEKGPEVSLSVDGEDREIDRLPGSSEGIAAVVPTDADIVLSVTDEDRTQSINLRDGSRDSQIDGYYNAGTTSKDLDDYSERGKATGKPDDEGDTSFKEETREVRLGLSVGEATRAPWDEENGWADEDKVWVSVPVSELVTDSVWGFSTADGSNEPILNWKLKEDGLFGLEPDGGKKIKPEGDTEFAATDSADPLNDAGEVEFDPASANVVFQVPDDTKQATLHITPGGSMTAKWKDREGKASWDSKPDTGKIIMNF